MIQLTTGEKEQTLARLYVNDFQLMFECYQVNVVTKDHCERLHSNVLI